MAAMLYAGYLLLPHYIADYQLADTMDSTARMGTADAHTTESAMKDDVLREARYLNVPLDRDDLHVVRINNEVMIWGDYTIHVDMPWYPFDLHFAPMSKSKVHAGDPRLGG